jgi:RES domain-containing protein
VYVWRVCKQKHEPTAFSGDGGLYAPSRWMPQGFRVVYTAETLALATLELFVHTESNKIPLVAIWALLPQTMEIEAVDVDMLPVNWHQPTAYSALQKLGKNWLLSNRTPILKVPSAIVPVEFNYLLNPQHPDFEVEQSPSMQFRFDNRMWKNIPE